MIIIINYLCHHYCYWHVCWLWLGLLALRPSVLSFFFFWVRHLFLSQSTTRVITECDSFFITMYDKSYYKVRQLFSYKVRRMLLQSVAAFFYYRLRLYFIRKLRKDVMTKCNRYYKVRQVFIKKLRQFYYKVWQVLQNATGTIKCYV